MSRFSIHGHHEYGRIKTPQLSLCIQHEWGQRRFAVAGTSEKGGFAAYIFSGWNTTNSNRQICLPLRWNFVWGRYPSSSQSVPAVSSVQFRFAETLALTLTPNPNFGESGFGESGRHRVFEFRCALNGKHSTSPQSLLNLKRKWISDFGR